MKIYIRIFLLLFLSTPSFCFENKTYSISVCTTSSKEDANRCKENISKTSNLETFVQENPNGTYSTYLGNFTNYNEAKNALNNSSNFIKKQKPFIKEIKKFVKSEDKENIPQEKQPFDEKINEKIKEIDKEIKKIDENIKEEKDKALIDEQLKNTKAENQKIKDENTKAFAQIQKIENEKQVFDEKLRKADNEKNKILNEKSLIEEQKKQALAEAQNENENRKNAETEIQRIKDEKALIDEQLKNTKAENQKAKETETLRQAEMEKKRVKINPNFMGYLDEMKKLNGEATSSIKPNSVATLNNTDSFENLIIKVDSTKNIMLLKGKNKNGEIIDIKTYKVSTAKTSVKKPQGIGSITSISLNPQWNPTAKTIKVFKDKGINLPSVVPFGDKLNYMGAAKINLSHRVDGQEVYRIHGTLSEDTIGTNESGGCIRMKNKEVVELASYLDKFSKTKSLNNISVILE